MILKIGDYGSLRAVDQTFLTENVFTASWAAPEILFPGDYQLSGNFEDGSMIELSENALKADIFSAGYLFWFIWTIESPHHMATAEENKRKVSDCLAEQKPPLPISSNNPYKTLIEKCWNYDIKNRPSASELLDELEDLSPYGNR